MILAQTVAGDWDDNDEEPPSFPTSQPGHPQEYRYGSSDEEDEEGEGTQGQLQVREGRGRVATVCSLSFVTERLHGPSSELGVGAKARLCECYVCIIQCDGACKKYVHPLVLT